jgi:hypothetical protein
MRYRETKDVNLYAKNKHSLKKSKRMDSLPYLK